jgi:hypothetical protein
MHRVLELLCFITLFLHTAHGKNIMHHLVKLCPSGLNAAE